MADVTLFAWQNDTLDLLCWRAFGRTAAIVELALEKNPQLAQTGELLAEGAPVAFPGALPTPVVPLVELWD